MIKAVGALALVCAIAATLSALDSPASGAPAAKAASKTQPPLSVEALFTAQCGGCHGSGMDGGQFAPALKGADFATRWKGKNAELLKYVSSQMPPNSSGALSDGEYAAVVDLIVRNNGGQGSGGAAKPQTAKANSEKTPAASPALTSSGAAAPALTTGPRMPARAVFHDAGYESAMAQRKALLNAVSPVTAKMLREPPAADWLYWRGAADSAGYSPLDQINKTTALGLKLKWSWSLKNGKNEIAPLVHDGVMFINSSSDVEALDAATGTLLWRYSREIPPEYRGPLNLIQRNIAIYGRLVYTATADRHLVALDAASGKVMWDAEVVSPSIPGVVLSSGPIVANGVLVQGISRSIACPGGCGMVGLDPASGKILWRFNTIAKPGQPGGDSWNGVPPEQRNGAAIWTAASYDPQLDLVYFGTGNSYDVGKFLKPDPPAAGQSNEGLYTNSTIALRPKTGKLVWHHQHMPREVWDLDESFERTLINIPVDGKSRDLVVSIGKMGILDALDRKDGRYAFSIDLGQQNIVTSIDPKTGRRTVDPNKIPKANQPIEICPSLQGARNWLATAFNPISHVLYVPIQESCMDFAWAPAEETAASKTSENKPSDGKAVEGKAELAWSFKARPDSDGRRGQIQAIDLVTRKPLWIDRQRFTPVSSLLATGGGLLFGGDADRIFSARDESTGKALWQTRLAASPNSTPITFSVGGKQYVAIVTGAGAPMVNDASILTPELESSAPATTLWVFGL